MLPFKAQKQEILVKKQAATNPSYGCFPDKRPLNGLINCGIINLNKPAGPTSHQVSAYVQKILGIEKAGHSGTLDPNVAGVLPVATGDGTKVIQAIMPAGKEYICLMHLHKDIDEMALAKALKSFVGRIKQLPPIKSAVKRVIREKEIYYLDVLEIDGRNVLFKVGCQAGTYIRKLCHDIGQKIGAGAHMQELVRTKAGPFNLSDSITLQDLADAFWYYRNENNERYLRHCIQPIEKAVKHLPKIWILDSAVDSLCHGAKLAVQGIAKLDSGIKAGLVAVLTLKGELVCLATMLVNSEDIMKKEGGIVASLNRVFMKIGVYPKIRE